ncbi:MAG: hypothetical protein COA44_09395 [Arcobacter sp.]|nr:MAG: hypothetical protein COA44_09395 [Arcobacter sp.]
MKMFLLMLGLSSFLFSEVLKISFSRSSSEPYVYIDKRQLTGGVLKELMDALSKQSGIKMEYVLVSKRNQEKELIDGNIDGACLLNQNDFFNATKFQWSSVLYVEEDVLIVRKEDASNLHNITSLYGHKVGTIQSHSYPHLDPYFHNNSIQRVDNKKLSNNINQLRFGVIDAVVDTKLAVGHCIQKKNMQDKLIVSNKTIDTQDLHCAFRKDMDISLERINSALFILKEKGVINKILQKYKASL